MGEKKDRGKRIVQEKNVFYRRNHSICSKIVKRDIMGILQKY
jgi:hypothetical protein